MDTLLDEYHRTARRADLSKSVKDLQKTIDALGNARSSISSDSTSSSITLVKLQNTVKGSLDDVNGGLKNIYNALGKYSKALDKKFKDKSTPASEYDALSSQSELISRAIGMHFLREGQFAVASTFLSESTDQNLDLHSATFQSPTAQDNTLAKPTRLRSEALRQKFGEMYHILDQMKNYRNLEPAASWASEHSPELEARGSNLEFELCRLQFVWLFRDESGPNSSLRLRQVQALRFARQHLARFQTRHLREIQQLLGAMAFCPNLTQSPYRQYFHDESAADNLSLSFTKEFCSLLGLSADSPVYIATTAGAIALPTLQKLQMIMETKRTEWTTQNELPVEIALPPAYRFHSIFVCPVSKEQSTDSNPPMMMPCGHVIAKESLYRLSKVSRFKCPYCPGESQPSDARELVL